MTDKITRDGAGLDALDRVLERFGADRTRWPAPVRREFAGLLATSAEAQRRLREAEALDRLLDLAPAPAFDTRALADRIMAAVEAETPAAARAPAPKPWSIFERRRAPARPASLRAPEAQWPAAALLAASLVLGAVFGLSGTLDTALNPMVAEATEETEIDPGLIAFDSGGLDMFEEDLL